MNPQRSPQTPPNEASRRLVPALISFAIALVGVALVFLSFAIDVRWLGRIGFGITLIGIAGGFTSSAHGWWLFFTRR